MDPARPHTAVPLLEFNCQLIAQARALTGAHTGGARASYVGLVGPHMRHVIEHYEALLMGAQHGVVDYDARPRDMALQTHPHRALDRLTALHHALAHAPVASLNEPLQVCGLGGLAGDFAFQVPSSLGRELVFLASHTVHHFALLAGHCQQQGIATPEGFGKAPATRAHERESRIVVLA